MLQNNFIFGSPTALVTYPLYFKKLSASNISAGAYSAVPRSLGIAAPTDVFNSLRLHFLINQARRNLNQTAIEYSNGNPKLAKGIEALLEKALELYEKGTELPLELNLGMSFLEQMLSPSLSYDTSRTWLFWYDSIVANKSPSVLIAFCRPNSIRNST